MTQLWTTEIGYQPRRVACPKATPGQDPFNLKTLEVEYCCSADIHGKQSWEQPWKLLTTTASEDQGDKVILTVEAPEEPGLYFLRCVNRNPDPAPSPMPDTLVVARPGIPTDDLVYLSEPSVGLVGWLGLVLVLLVMDRFRGQLRRRRR